jgi:hypothetical protein
MFNLDRTGATITEPYQLLLRTSLTLAIVGGFGLGLYLLLSFALRLPIPGTVGSLIQVHGQVQALGFVAIFIMAVASRLVPRLHHTRLVAGRAISVGGLMLAVGVLLRGLSQPVAPSTPRDGVVLFSAFLALGGVLVAGSAFARTVRSGTARTAKEPLVLPLTMAGSLVAALLLNLLAGMGLAGETSVPFALDEAILHLELFGFASTMIFAIGQHAWPNLLLLRPTRLSFIRPSLILWAIGTFGVPLSWLVGPGVMELRVLATLAQLAGSVLYVHALRLFEPSVRASSIPRVTNPARAWARTAFVFLLLSTATSVVTAVGGLLAGWPTTFTTISAARHALAQGFLLPLIVFMASRILPGYSSAMVGRPRFMNALMWTLFAGSLLRAVGELAGGYVDGWNLVVACGGALGTVAFLVFAVTLWRMTPRTVQHGRTLPVVET